MAYRRLCLAAAALFWLAASTSWGADPPPAKEDPLRGDVQALAAKIDDQIARRWKVDNVEPAAAADDAEFMRRVYLDLAGRIPAVSEAHAFFDDPRPDKRLRLVEKLLGEARYVVHFTNVWRALLLPEANTNIQTRILVPGFEAWLRKELLKNVGYDEMVREILTAQINQQDGRLGFAGGPQQGEPTPFGYYLAKELKPENLGASTARLFLGVKLECAQCHNHPFADWKREQFWSYAAFFAGMQRQGMGDFVAAGREVPDRRELPIPGTEKVAQAKYLDGTEPQWTSKSSSRQTLSDWVTAADNPFFAKAAVNRMWAYLFGTGLVDPVDEIAGAQSTTNHRELLDLLAKDFAAHKFDLKYLLRAITASRAYQLTSAGASDQDQAQLFARMPVRGLTAEQLFDSVIQATYTPDSGTLNDPRIIFAGQTGGKAEFVGKFGDQADKTTEHTTSILQALALMNGKMIADATTVERSELLAGIADAPFLDTAGKVETLYLAALSRKPKAKELARMVNYIDNGGGDGKPGITTPEKERQRKQALADVFWVLLNSGEFMLNH